MANENKNTIDSNIEGRATPEPTIRSETRGGKKGAGNVGSSNVNHVA